MLVEVQARFGAFPKRCLVVFCLITFSGNAFAEDPTRILFIGNSYTQQIRSTVQNMIFRSPHKSVVLEFVAPGGKTLAFHSQQQSTLDRIRNGKWDIVVLQDQSQTPAVYPKRFLQASKQLHQIISETGAATAYYQTWGRRDGDQSNRERYGTYASMQAALNKAYQSAAVRDDAILVPVGEAWQKIRQLNPGIGKSLYRKDGSHPSANGAYLAGLCFYCLLLKGDPEDLRFSGQVDATTQSICRKVVHQVISEKASALEDEPSNPTDAAHD